MTGQGARSRGIARIVNNRQNHHFRQNRQESSLLSRMSGILLFLGVLRGVSVLPVAFIPGSDSETGDNTALRTTRIPMKPPYFRDSCQKVTKKSNIIAKVTFWGTLPPGPRKREESDGITPLLRSFQGKVEHFLDHLWPLSSPQGARRAILDQQ